METIEDIAFEVGLLEHQRGGAIALNCIENKNYSLYYAEPSRVEYGAIEVVRRGAKVGRFYMQKDLPKLIEFLEDNNFLM